ncbi:MAG: endolytic transglycosylase MltG [Thermodesulfobacteriota bacterium]
MRKLLITSLGILFLGLTITLSVGTYVNHSMTRAQDESGRDILIKIDPGEGFAAIEKKLADRKLLHSPQVFMLWAKFTGKASRIQAGEFRLNTSWSQARILEHLVSGQEALHKLRIPEGLAWWETAALAEKAGLCTRKDFSRAMANCTLLRELQIKADTAEGFLFPDTYLLPKRKHGNAAKILAALVNRFWSATQGLWAEMNFEAIRDKVILASLVEKETGAPEERRRIAGVLANRLQKGMRLQCDPTVIYGIGLDFDGNLKKKDLLNKGNSFNTYRHAGLPPGPICSPGLEAVKAALNPEKHDFLYFVSKGDGTHKFSRTLREHNRAVRKFQLQ